MKISKFFANDYVDQASYDNLRKIASLVDGQKNASRKTLHTILEKNIKNEIKVSQLGSKIAEFTEYLHGSVDGVVVGLAQNYPGTNNVPLLVREGNFGTRFKPDPSASRYIYTHGSDEFFELFKKDDSPNLIKQFFEGTEIEPMFFVPSLPILLLNGSEGVSSGYAQKILPRNPEDVKKYLMSVLDGKSPRTKLIPYFEGFTGIVEQGENSAQWIIKGIVEKSGMNKVRVTEVPIGYNLKSYIKVLDDLEDRKVIQSYKDKSDGSKFHFEITIPSKTLKEWDENTLLDKLKLVKKVSENYTVIDEENKIKVYDSINDILNKYIEVKLEYMGLRKKSLKEKFESDIELDYSKYIFIKLVVDNKLKIAKRKKADIEKDLEKVKDIIKRDDSYNYLLNMPILNLTTEEMDRLDKKIKTSKGKLKELIKTSVEQLWKNDI